MTLQSLLDSSNSQAQQSILALLTLREKLVSTKNKLMAWLAEVTDPSPTRAAFNDGITISVPDTLAGTGYAIATVTKEAYLAAIEDGDALIDLVVNTAGDTVTVAGDTIIEAVEQSVQAAQTQSEYISYCLNSATVKASEFAGLLSSKFQFISAEVIDQLSSMLESGDAFTAIKTFASTYLNFSARRKTAESGNDYITVTSASAYTGVSVWEVAWNQFVDTASSFFEGLAFSIFALGDFFRKLWDGIVNLAKWLVGKLFKPLTTRFEKGGATVGLFDLPVFQFYVGDYTISDNGPVITASPNLNQAKLDYLNWRGSNAMLTTFSQRAKLKWSYYTSTDLSTYTLQRLYCIFGPCFEAVDGVYYTRPYDIIVPGYANNSLVLRIGPTEDGRLIISLFNHIPAEYLESLNDKQIAGKMQFNFEGFMDKLAEEVPCLDFDPVPPGMAPAMKTFIERFFEESSSSDPDDNYDLASKLHYLNVNAAYDQEIYFWVLFGLLPFTARRSPDAHSWATNKTTLDATFVCGDALIAGSYGSFDDYDISADFFKAYKPYTQNSLTGVGVHYQTIDEQASEIWHYVIAAVIAAAAIFATIKFIKFRRKRIALQDIRAGYVDNMSWNLPMNPSNEQIAEYNKAKRKFLRTSRMNSLLGISSPSESAAQLTKSIFSVTDRVTSTQIGAKALNAITNGKIDLVDTVANSTDAKVSNLSTSVSNVKADVDTLSGDVGTVSDKADALQSTINAFKSDTTHDMSAILYTITGVGNPDD